MAAGYYTKVRKLLMEAKEKNKTEYDKNSNPQLFLEGDKVLLFDETVRRGRLKKLSSQWVGPFSVVGVDGVNVIIKKAKGKEVKVHSNRLKLFF